ncbi:MAG: transporter substrate-binding domain-containing protein [Pseudomonadota bacterium]
MSGVLRAAVAAAVLTAFMGAAWAEDAPEADEDPVSELIGAAAVPEEVASEAISRILNVGILDDAPPFSMVNRFGIRAGLDVDVARGLCNLMGVVCEQVPLDTVEMVPALRDRRIDVVVAALPTTEQFDEFVDFSNPYMRTPVRFVVAQNLGGDLEAQKPTVFGALASTAQAQYLTDTYGKNSTVRLYATTDEMWIDLALGRLDSVLAPAIAARQEFLTQPIGRSFEFSKTAVSDPKVVSKGASIAVREGDSNLLASINQALSEMTADPDYEQMLSRHIPNGLAMPPTLD